MQRRKFIAGVGSLAAGAAAVTGTGAFTSVSANRSVAVDVADDSDALLAIEPQATPNGNEYASKNSGTVELDFSGTDVGGGGLNRNAETIIRDILQVRNQGTQDVIVGVTGLPDFMSIYTDDGSVAANGNSTSLNQDSYDPSSGNLALVEVGETMNDVGVIFRLKGEDASALEDFSGTLTFNAVAVSELDDPDDVRNKYDSLGDIESDPETGTGGLREEQALITGEISDGPETTVTATVNGDVYPEFPRNDSSYQAELIINVDNDGLGNNDDTSDDFRLGYAGADAQPGDLSGEGAYVKQRTDGEDSTPPLAGGRVSVAGSEVDGYSATEEGGLAVDGTSENTEDVVYTFTIDWSAFAADSDTNIDSVPSEFEVNEVFISDGGGVFGNGLNGRAVGLGDTYSTD